MKTRISVLVLAIVATFLAAASCSTPQFCASQQSSGGPQLFAYMLGLSPAYMPHPPGYIDRGPTYEFVREVVGQYTGACGQIICAESEVSARAAFATTVHDPNAADPSLFVYQLGYSVADVGVGMVTGWPGWTAAGSPCIGGYSTETPDGGSYPCKHLGETCSVYVSGPLACCETEALVPGQPPSTIVCDVNINVENDPSGICRADLRQPCVSGDQCLQNGALDGLPLTCTGPAPGYLTCCLGPDRTCLYSDLVVENDGCCDGLACVPDAIGNDWWCQ